jgi:hypothetical protein
LNRDRTRSRSIALLHRLVVVLSKNIALHLILCDRRSLGKKMTMRTVILLLLGIWSAHALVESERQEEYKARNYTWPIPEMVPETPGWRRLMQRRFRQIEAMEGTGQRCTFTDNMCV